MIKESPLMIKSKVFALDDIKVCKELRTAKGESALINQFLCSGTSIGTTCNNKKADASASAFSLDII